MKYIIKTLVMAILTFTIMSCNKSDDNNEEDQFVINAKIDGVDFESGFCDAYRTDIFDNESGSITPNPEIIISCTSLNTNNERLTLKLPIGIQEGTYDLNLFSGLQEGLFAVYKPENETELNAVSGSITITEHDTNNETIKGSFNFSTAPPVVGSNSTPQYTITEGRFNANYNLMLN